MLASPRCRAVLLIELDGLKDGMERLAERIMEICRKIMPVK
jgi:ubiquinone biosynthesis protein UbiJ